MAAPRINPLHGVKHPGSSENGDFVFCEHSTSPLVISKALMEGVCKQVAFVAAKMEEWFRAAGAIEVIKNAGNGPGLSTHAFGGTRMGGGTTTTGLAPRGYLR